MEIFVKLLGQWGLIGLIGFILFIFSYKHSVAIFDWVERQTFGTRTYILEKLELLFIEVNPDHITYTLLMLSFGIGLLTMAFFGLISMWPLGIFLGIVLSIVGWKIPRPFIDFLVEKRIKEYQGQMVDALTLLSNGLRAGLTVPQSIGLVVDELPNPISQEFNLILQQNKIGVPLEECLENLAKRVPTEDNEMFVTSVNILRETGGNLAEVFDTIVSVIRERVRLQQKVDTYVAQGMFQGVMIFCMPFAIGIIYFLSDPTSMTNMFSKPIGIVLAILALFLDLIGGFFILKIVKIKI